MSPRLPLCLSAAVVAACTLPGSGSSGGLFPETTLPGTSIPPPTDVTVTVAVQSVNVRTGPITVSWKRDTAVTTRVKLERTVTGTWAELPVAADAASYQDDDLADSTTYMYRVSAGTDTAWSEPALSNPVGTDLVPPRNLAVTPVTGGYQLTWKNQSTTADTLLLERLTGGDSHWTQRGLSIGDSSSFDALDPAWPNTRYRLTVKRGVFDQATTHLVTVPPIVISRPFLTLKGSDLVVPADSYAARSATGALFFADTVTNRLFSFDGQSWTPHVVEGMWSFAPPGVAVDGAGHPHTVWIATGNPMSLHHEWWDGSAWHAEKFADLTSSSGDWFFGVAADGTVHAFWDDSGLWHAVKSGATWSSPQLVANAHVQKFTVTPDGTAYAAFASGLYTRPAGGAWSYEAAPGVGIASVTNMRLAAGDANHVGLLVSTDDGHLGTQVTFLMRSSGTWSSEPVIDLPPSAYSWSLGAAALSADGARAHVVLDAPQAGVVNSSQLIARTASGWQAMQLGPSGADRAFTGYGADGKVWVLVATGGPFGATVDEPFYLEP